MPRVELAADEAEWFTFRAHGRKWRVLLVLPDHEMLESDDAEGRVFGICDYDSRTIYVDASASSKSVGDTMLHELMHASAFEGLCAPLRDTALAADVEEVLIRCMTPVACRVARITWPTFPPEAAALRRVARKRSA